MQHTVLLYDFINYFQADREVETMAYECLEKKLLLN